MRRLKEAGKDVESIPDAPYKNSYHEIALKRMLRDMAGEGLIEPRRRKLHRPGTLPSITLADIVGRDPDPHIRAMMRRDPRPWEHTN